MRVGHYPWGTNPTLKGVKMKYVVLALMAVAQIAGAAPVQKLSFEDLKQACQDPKKFQNQIEPTDRKSVV